MRPRAPRGRGAATNPASRFETMHVEWDAEERASRRTPTVVYRDRTRSILTANDSPDVGFRLGLNPYRGCEHGCAYCYARVYHEYLGFSAGLDFETRIVAKEEAPALLEAELSRPAWRPEPIALAGATDVYQPVERRLLVTRGVLEVLARFRNPVGIVTKNRLVLRDLDVLAELAAFDAVSVAISVTTLDPSLAASLEPRASRPAARLEAVRALADAGIPTTVLVAPVIPGLTDHEIYAILEAARDAGARAAGYTVLRLPGAVEGVFRDWLTEHVPDRRTKVLNRLRSLRGGRLDDPRFGVRMRGEGAWAASIRALFDAARRKTGLGTRTPPLSTEAFRVPGRQLSLFEEAGPTRPAPSPRRRARPS